jgi:hypothetical protein
MVSFVATFPANFSKAGSLISFPLFSHFFTELGDVFNLWYLDRFNFCKLYMNHFMLVCKFLIFKYGESRESNKAYIWWAISRLQNE